SDLTSVAEADLVFVNGAGYEESLLAAIENAGETVNIVTVSACVEIRPFGAAMHDDEEHAHEEEHDDADDHDDDHDADEDDQDDESGHDDDHADDDDHDDDDNHDDDHDGAHDDDEDHADEHGEMDGAIDCDGHDAEFNALVDEEEDGHAHFATLGRLQDIDCSIAHGQDDGHAHGEGACDPHIWLDPHNVIYWVLMIRDALSAADPDNAASYAANAEAYALELIALESDFILPALEALPAEKRVLVTSHESMGYFATTFGFEIVTTVVPGMSTMVEPSARDIAALIDRVSAEGVPAIFGDTQTSEAIMRTIASAVGIEIFGLYSDTLTESDGPASTYLDYMRYNMTTIVSALQG
ncbi:MAG: zinc ABC transporter substrate-binding protein, partial [Anaerolineae bacterium]|nr:zinc ABC transporter substrate-binding protein [Anaerolineae bacterium]